MKILIILFLITAVVHAADVPIDSVDGIPFDLNPNDGIQVRTASVSIEASSWGSVTPPRPEFVCEENDPFKVHCDADCSTQIFCMGHPKPFTIKKCPPNAKYCVDGECSTIPDVMNSNCKILDLPYNPFSEYRCTAPNDYFPDPKNCSRYYYCDNEKELHGYYCPPGYVYNSCSRNRCYKSYNSQDCSEIDCNEKVNGTFLTYKGNHLYYGFCAMREERTDIYMFKCKNSYHYLNENTQKCEFRCEYDGKFDHPKDTNQYYECYYAADGQLSYLIKCNPGYMYDEKTLTCIKY